MNRIAAGYSDKGRIREGNEDTFFISDSKIGQLPNLFIVADGMGGHNAGEVASVESVSFFRDFVSKKKGKDLKVPYYDGILNAAVEFANRGVYELSQTKSEMQGMGTTFTACCTNNTFIYYAHIGDSRIYIINKDGIKQVTSDHTYVAELVAEGAITGLEARKHPKRNIVTRALGTEAEVSADTGYVEITAADRVLMCSDGLTDMLTDEEILEIVNSADETPENIARLLVDIANEKGGVDNITVVLF
jgi:protein phosphatase